MTTTALWPPHRLSTYDLRRLADNLDRYPTSWAMRLLAAYADGGMHPDDVELLRKRYLHPTKVLGL